MDETQKRRMRDQHGRDEAQMRRSQQDAAGGARLVQPYPPHGDASALPRTSGSALALARSYEEAATAEQAAWSRVGALPGEPGHDGGLWQAWRAAVEARDHATRVLINHSMGGDA